MLNFAQKGRKLPFLIVDIILIALAIYLAFFLRFESQIPANYLPTILGMIIIALIISIPIFYFYGLYSFSWSYVSTNELISLAKATALGFLFFGASTFILRDQEIFQGLPRSTLIISYFLIFLFCGAARFSKRIYLQTLQKGFTEEKERTLIVGAEDAGEQILRSIFASKNSLYFPIGFVDNNPVKQGELIHGVKVLGKIDDIPFIVDKSDIKKMIIALSSGEPENKRNAFEMGVKAGIEKKNIKIVQSVSEIIDGKVSTANIREVQIEDLLQREPVSLDSVSIGNFIFGKSILVTGAAGSIGSELCRQIAKFNPSQLLLLDQDETGIFNISEELKYNNPKLNFIPIISNIQDTLKTEKIFNEFRPNIVFHAAAYKHVPLMEENPDEAVKNNIFGTKVVTEASLESGVEKFIFVSTDKAVNPISVMGQTKRIGEMICQALNKRKKTRFISVRFGNVLDSRGSVIPIFREQIKSGRAVEVTHPEMKRYFMVISEACLLVMQAGAIGEGGEVFVLNMGEPIKILDLAKEMIRFSGFEPDKDIHIVFTEPRPGEKLFEEILTAEEGTIATQNQNIFRAKLSEVDEKKLSTCLERLGKIVQKKEKDQVVNILKDALRQLIPSYKGQKTEITHFTD